MFAGGAVGMSMLGMVFSPLVFGIFIEAILAQQEHPPVASEEAFPFPGSEGVIGAIADLLPPHIIELVAGALCAFELVSPARSIIPQPAAPAGRLPMTLNAAAAKMSF